jgi:hypothetical protein
MSADAIFRVTQVLRTRLQQALVAAGDPGSVFVGPLDDADAQGASLILFLYRMVPNPSLRNSEHRVPSPLPPPPYLVHRDSLPLDLYYLVTVGSRAGASEEPLLRVLGFAIQAMQGEPDLPGSIVTPGGLRISLEPDVVRVTFEPLSTDEVSRIWALFPTANYRTSVAYLASPVWIDPPATALPAARVVHDRLRAGQRATLPAP